MPFKFDKTFLVLILLTLTIIGFNLLKQPKKGYLKGYASIEGKVIATSFNRAIVLDKSNRLWKVYTYKSAPLQVGDEVLIRGKFYRWKVYPSQVRIRRSFIQKLRIKIHNLLKEQFLKTADTKVAKKLGSALLFGENWFSYKERQKLAHLGIYHLIVISGFHYALFLTVLFFIPVKWKLRYWVALAFFSFFTFLILFPKAPAYRAFVSITLFVIARLLERKYHPLKALLIAASVSLLLYPYWLSNVGFWLSYLASLALILYYANQKTPEEDFLRSFFGKSLGLEATLVVSIVITPLIASFFGFISYGEFVLSPLFTWIVQMYLLVGTLNLLTFWSLPPLTELQNLIAALFGSIFYSIPDKFFVKVGQFPAWLSFLLVPLNLFVVAKFKKQIGLLIGFFIVEVGLLLFFKN